MHIAAFQSQAGFRSVDERLSALASALDGKSLDLVVCPELFLTGYNIGEALKDFSKDDLVNCEEKLKPVATGNQTAIVYGFPEATSDGIYNSARCMLPDGRMAATHRKLAIPPGFERDVFQTGKAPTLFELGGITCAILICYDAEFPETVRAVAASGAQLVIVPTALSQNWQIVAQSVMPARAFENGVYLAYANHAGKEGDITYAGQSCILDPYGNDLARAGHGQELISAGINPANVAIAQNRLPYVSEYAALQDKLTRRDP